MNRRALVKKIIQVVDEKFLAIALSTFGDRAGIRGLLFHTVFSDCEELSLNHIHPQQRLTIDQYDQIFKIFLERGYQFLGYRDLKNQLKPDGKYVYVTFDDGYYNNVRILPLIEQLNIPIHIFVTTGNIVEGKKYWWDVVYQYRAQSGVSQQEIDIELRSLKRLRVEEIQNYVLDNFGADSFRPLSDLDRPLFPEELGRLAKHELVTIGNHTRNHAIATLLTENEIKREIIGAREDCKRITGQDPLGFAFPNGNHRPQDLRLVRSMGIDLILSTEPRNNRIRRNSVGVRPLVMDRYCLNERDLVWQASIIRMGSSPFLIAQRIRAHIAS